MNGKMQHLQDRFHCHQAVSSIQLLSVLQSLKVCFDLIGITMSTEQHIYMLHLLV